MISCVSEALTAGKITKKLADDLSAYENIDDAIAVLTLDMARQKREAAIQALRIADGWDDVTSHSKGVYRGLAAVLSRDMTDKAGYNNIDKLAKFYENRYHSMFMEAIEAFRTKSFGFTQDKEGMRTLIGAVYGKTVDDPEIMKFAKQLKDLIEEMRKDFNAQGGSISKNEDYLLPQKHDARTIKNVGLEQWKAATSGRLDRTKMTDDVGNTLSDQELDTALDYVYETITTRGLNKITDFSVPKLGKKLSRKGSERRFLYFKDAESWIANNEEFGGGDIFTTLTDHIQSRANDIAVLERLGPNPDAAYSALFAMAEKQGLKDSEKSWLNSLWHVASGKVNGGDMAVAGEIGSTTRNVIAANTLGSAMLSAVGDVGYQFIAAAHNGLPIMKVYKELLSQVNPANAEGRMFAARIGLGMDEFTSLASGGNRYADIHGQGVSAKVADKVLRLSFLTQWTAAGQSAYGKVFAAEVAAETGQSFGKLSKKRQRLFDIYGITEADWDAFRKQPLLEYRGVKHIDVTQKGSKKFHQMIISETDLAVPNPDANTRAATSGGTDRNSITGQIVRTGTNLLSFPITILQTHGYRMYNMEGLDRYKYAGMMLAIPMMFGSLSLQVKDIAAGRTPRETGFEDMDLKKIAKHTKDSFVQGGAGGLLADFLLEDHNRYGGGVASNPLGVTGDFINKAAELTLGNAAELLEGKETNAASEAIQFAKRLTPDTWQSKLITDGLYDHLTIMIDPGHQNKVNRQMRAREKDDGNSHWWKKGQLPEALQ
jgi:hypothetical protein